MTKETVNDLVRHIIGTLRITVTFNTAFPEEQRALLERTARTCPVHRSLHQDLSAPLRFVYPP